VSILNFRVVKSERERPASRRTAQATRKLRPDTALVMWNRNLATAFVGLIFLLGIAPVSADEITYRTEDGKTVTSQGQLSSPLSDLRLLERWDGQIQPLRPSQVIEHKETGPATPITCDEMADRIRQLFGEELVRIEAQPPMVVALVLTAPLAPKTEPAAQIFARKGMRFMQNVSTVFAKYAKQMEFPLRDVQYPLVLLIFEAEQDFDDYYNSTTGARGLSASGVLGFYSHMTNWLAVRMSSCDSFEVPLHEAIHQQMSNRVMQRLAPTPRWFDEGIANAFEGTGDRVDSNPGKLNANYIRRAQQIRFGTSWATMMGDDRAFLADVIAGDAYTLAWCLHWMAWTQHKQGYKEFVQALSQRKPFEELPPQAEDVLFQKCFGMSLNEMQTKFPATVQAAAKRQKFNLPPVQNQAPDQKALCQYKINAVISGGQQGALQLSGSAMNISPFREMTFYITVETDAGYYYEFLLPGLKPRQQVRLAGTPARKPIPGMTPRDSATYRVFVRSVLADTVESANWIRGNVPGPMTAQN